MDDDLRKLMTEVPETCTDGFAKLTELTDAFCDTHLGAEYKELSREMAAAICQEGLPVLKGKPQGWAAGILYALGGVNFLTDPTRAPYMKSTEIAEGFGVSVATMHGKAKVIRQALDLIPLHPSWCLPSQLDDNPLVWMLEVNGLLLDIRHAPREAQIAAYENGLIPYVPADQQTALMNDGE